MAKKAAAKKKSTKAEPAAKAAKKKPTKAEPAAKAAKTVGGGGKKTATKRAARGATITQDDLAQVYAKAWVDEAFRTLLETDPTAALKQYAAENGLQWSKLVHLPPNPGDANDDNCIHLVSCC